MTHQALGKGVEEGGEGHRIRVFLGQQLTNHSTNKTDQPNPLPQDGIPYHKSYKILKGFAGFLKVSGKGKPLATHGDGLPKDIMTLVPFQWDL